MSNRYCLIAPGHEVHGPYHDKEYGFSVSDEHILFERLALEIMQAGLSWEIVLKKRKALNKASEQFQVVKVAAYAEKDIERLLADASIIRNHLKIKAIIHNANVILQLRQSHGGFAQWIEFHHPLTKTEWVKLFKKTFAFTGGEIVNEFLMSIGYLAGAHGPECGVYTVISKQKPAWQNIMTKKPSKA